MKQKSGLLYLILCVSLITLIAVMIIALALVLKNNSDKKSVTTKENSDPAVVTTAAQGGSETGAGTTEPGTSGAQTSAQTSAQTETEKPTTPAQTTKPETEKPVTEKPVTEKPETEKPVTEKPATDKPSTDKPSTDKPVTDKPVTEPTIPDTPVTPDKDEADRSGTFYSSDNSKFRLAVDWDSHVEKDSDTATVHFDIYLECYTIIVGSRSDGVIKIGDKSFTFKTARVNKEDNVLSRIKIASEGFDVDISESSQLDVAVKWHFKGSYSGIEYDWMEASEKISVR